jgi:predicted Zn-ribbon and HTH transcriptional regulator
MTTRFASAKKALALCDVCGFQYKLRELKNLSKEPICERPRYEYKGLS